MPTTAIILRHYKGNYICKTKISHGTTPAHRSKLSTQNYELAITRTLPRTFAKAIVQRHGISSPLCMARAREQHENFTAALRQLLPEVIELPAIDCQPDSCFVEDTALVSVEKGRAVIFRMGHPLRQGEVESIRVILEDHLRMDVINMKDDMNKEAKCDGGDVLFTGRHLFVGLSNRTNPDGARFLSDAFSNLDTIIVPPISPVNRLLHLKSVVTHIDDSTLVVPEGKAGDEILKAMNADKLGYQSIRLPDGLACNLISCNGALIAQDTICEISKERLVKAASERQIKLRFVDTSELAKKDAALTCCCLLLKGC